MRYNWKPRVHHLRIQVALNPYLGTPLLDGTQRMFARGSTIKKKTVHASVLFFTNIPLYLSHQEA